MFEKNGLTYCDYWLEPRGIIKPNKIWLFWAKFMLNIV